MGSLNWVDVVLGLVVAGNCLLGVKRGILREAFNLAGIILGLFAGLRCYEALGWNIESWSGAKPAVANLVAFVVIFLAIAFGASYIGHLLHLGAKKLFVGWLDRLLGGAFGLARGLIFASVLALAFALFPVFPRLEQDLNGSVLGPHVVRVAPAIYGAVMEKLRGKDYKGLDVRSLLDEYLAEEEAGTGERGPGPAPPDEKKPKGKEDADDDFLGSD